MASASKAKSTRPHIHVPRRLRNLHKEHPSAFGCVSTKYQCFSVDPKHLVGRELRRLYKNTTLQYNSIHKVKRGNGVVGYKPRKGWDVYWAPRQLFYNKGLDFKKLKSDVRARYRKRPAQIVALSKETEEKKGKGTKSAAAAAARASKAGKKKKKTMEGAGKKSKTASAESGPLITQDIRKQQMETCEVYARFTLAEMKCRIVAEGVICHLGFEPEVAKGASDGAWLAVLRRIMDDGASFEEALLEWSAMSGEYRNRQWLAAHEDGKVNEGNGYEIISLLGKRSGHLMFPGDDLMLHYRPGVDCVVANLHKVLHMSDNKRGVGNWSKVTGPPCV